VPLHLHKLPLIITTLKLDRSTDYCPLHYSTDGKTYWNGLYKSAAVATTASNDVACQAKTWADVHPEQGWGTCCEKNRLVGSSTSLSAGVNSMECVSRTRLAGMQLVSRPLKAIGSIIMHDASITTHQAWPSKSASPSQQLAVLFCLEYLGIYHAQ
jgi:hypothetical protein